MHVGDLLGRIGASGTATGPRPHLEARVNDRPTDPLTFLFEHPRAPTTPPSLLAFVPIITVTGLAALRHRS